LELNSLENKHVLLPPRDLVAEIYRLENDLIDARDANLRSVADFKNYRRRTELEGSKIARESKREILFALLDIVDDMDKAVQYSIEARQPFMDGIRIIRKKFLTILQAEGVQAFESVGAAFDHNIHEAVAMDTHEGVEPRTVIDEFRRGYYWNDELLRPAQVRVSG
jgi:molecular chaperone GrpE